MTSNTRQARRDAIDRVGASRAWHLRHMAAAVSRAHPRKRIALYVEPLLPDKAA